MWWEYFTITTEDVSTASGVVSESSGFTRSDDPPCDSMGEGLQDDGFADLFNQTELEAFWGKRSL